MSEILCCLCCTPATNKYKYLQNDSGESNEIYEITVKYFDPMLLTEYNNAVSFKKNSALCENCWVHIKDFHDFQEAVIKTRTSLEQIIIQKSTLPIKIEEEHATTVFNRQELLSVNGVLIKTGMENENNTSENVGMCIDGRADNSHYVEDDEKSLNFLTRFKSCLESDKKIKNKRHNLKNKRVIKSRKVRKLQKSVNVSRLSHFTDGTDELNDENITSKASANDLGYHPALEKGRQYDKFIEEWKSQLECDICSQAFPMFDMLKVHFKEKHDSKAYVKCCDRKFDRRCSLVEHIRLHIDPEMHKCDICGKISRSKYNLKLHKKTIHEESQQFECNVCSKIFKQKPNLESHMLTHVTGNKDFKCNECPKAYVLESQLKRHIKLVHIDNRVCDQCGKTLHSIGALKNHLKEHSGIEKPKYPCNECGTVLGTNSSLKSHKAAYHSDGSTVYVCSICGKVSATERGLKNHKKYVHEIERKHVCPHCDKAFKRPKNLQEHIATHTGEALYECPHCPRSFKMHTKYHEHLKKAHPVEWEEGRKNRLEKQKINFERVTNKVVI